MVVDNASSTPPTTLVTHVKTIASPSKIKHAIVDFAINIKNIGVADPRRIAHSLKVPLAITVVSMVYFLRPIYNDMGEAGMWAILTVVLVLEYTVGATISKVLNRSFTTILAGVLGVGTESFASRFGPTVKPIVLGFLVFLVVAAITFSRFIPNIKKRYDYGVMIFILTFSLVSVSGYQVDEIIKLAYQRVTTIAFACARCVLISMCICPVWAGEGLHKLVVNNLENLASFLEGFGGEYYRISNGDKSFLVAYKSIFNSEATEVSLANFAWWEIGHGNFQFRHQWKKYLKIGVYTRQCAHHIETLTRHLEAKYEEHSEFQDKIKEPCIKMSSEVGKALKELASSLKLMIYPSSSAAHINNCIRTVDELNATLQASMIVEYDILETIPVIAATSVLVEIIKCVETIYEAIEELSIQINFEFPQNITSDTTENLHFLGRGSLKKPVEGGKDEGSIPSTVLSDDLISRESDLDKSKREIN